MSESFAEKILHFLAALFVLSLFVTPSLFMSATIPESWQSGTTPSGGNWTSVAWSPSLDKFVAVGNATAMSSADGVTWSSSTIPAGDWRSVTWSPDLQLFVAVGHDSSGEGSTIATSTDGVTWSLQTAPLVDEVNYMDLNGVAWSPARSSFVAIGDGPYAITSADGIAWSSTLALPAGTWNSIVWSPERGTFAVAGEGSTIITSTDGLAWTESTPLSASLFRSLAWSPDLGIFIVVSSSGAFATSSNGASWTEGTLPAPVGGGHGLAWSSELGVFAVVGSTGIATSPDGTAWTVVESPAGKAWRGVVWSPDLGVFATVTHDTGTDAAAYSAKVTPIVSGASIASIGFNRINVSWSTHIAASSYVRYGTTLAYDQSTSVDTSLTRVHSIMLTGLAPCTTYYMQAVSEYAGLEGVSEGFIDTTPYSLILPPVNPGEPGEVVDDGECVTVTTVSAGDFSSDGVLLTGSAELFGEFLITGRGFEISTSADLAGSTTIPDTAESFAEGTYSLTVGSLTCGTTYYYQAYTGGIHESLYQGEILSFAMPACEGGGTGGTGSGGTTGGGGGGTTSGGSSGGSTGGTGSDTGTEDHRTAIIPEPAPVPLPEPVFLFSTTLKLGSVSSDVAVLQKFLNDNGYLVAKKGPGSPGNETKTFGMLTMRAVSRFQADHAADILIPLGLSKPTGIFGPATMAVVNSML